ncbi:heparinase II/III family protein [Microbacterium indicum]|uniref:heparinase II/III family protein n=1 Tax=Microbacterium indicum TaxID=358100 RepID=UPI00041FA4DA|nr:heparinase II/III family protein [Microbacterium indicum]
MTGGFLARFGADARAALDPALWAPAPPVSERAAWAGLDAARLTAAADARRDEAAAAPPALSLWAHYAATGERMPYERAQRALLAETATAALAWGATGDAGAWAPRLADAVWRVCELTAWCLPSHYLVGADRPPLPIPGRDVLDLSCGYVGGMLAAIDRIAGDALDDAFPGIRARIRHEIRRRVLREWGREEHFWEVGEEGRPPNNWAPWIVSNVLACAMVAETDRDALVGTVERSLVVLDRFRAGYADDGSCEEGATYWWWAGATLFEALDLLAAATGGSYDGFAVAPVAAMARFPMAMQLGRGTQVNFSDGSPAHPPNAVWHLLARFGARVGDDEVVRHARWMGSAHPAGLDGQLAPLFLRTIAELRDPGWAAAGPTEPGMPASWYAPGTEVAIARERAHDASGFVVAAKGGHNAVSHNHNDAGGPIVSLDGEPVLIDVGVGDYVRETFMPDMRYAIWTMRSGWHSVPLPNGVEQAHGSAFRAAGTTFSDDGSLAALRMDLAPAYPPEAGLLSLEREIALDRAAGEVVIDDAWRFASPGEMRLVLMTAAEPEPAAGGLRVGAALLAFAGLAAETQRIDIDPGDSRLARAWGDAVFRTVLTTPPGDGSARVTIRRA